MADQSSPVITKRVPGVSSLDFSRLEQDRGGSPPSHVPPAVDAIFAQSIERAQRRRSITGGDFSAPPRRPLSARRAQRSPSRRGSTETLLARTPSDATELRLEGGMLPWQQISFQHLKILKLLDFLNPTIPTLPCSRSLEHLEIKSQYLIQFPNWLQFCEKLTTVILSHTKLPSFELNGIRNITRLELRENHQLQLPKEFTFLKLTILKIKNCSLKALPENFNCPELQELSIAGNQLERLPRKLAKSSGLNILDISRNCFKSLTNVFENLTNLETFICHHNQIETFPESVVHSLSRLRRLDIYRNRFTKLPLLSDWNELEWIRLHKNPGELTENDQAMLLAFQTEMSTGARYKPSAKTPRLRLPLTSPRDTEESVPGIRRRIKSARYSTCAAPTETDLRTNMEIQRLPADTKTLKYASVRVVDIHFDHFTSLQELSLTACSLEKFVLPHPRHLTEVNLSQNQFGEMPEFLASAKSLTRLNLSSNKISYGNTMDFSGLRHLEVLNLSRNQLSILPDNIFEGCSRLRELYLRGNALASLPASIIQLSHLERVSFNDELLAQASPAIVAMLSKFTRNTENIYVRNEDIFDISDLDDE